MTQYQVFVTPLVSSGVYGTEVEISDWVKIVGAGTIGRSIDSTDYDIGIYVFADVTLVCDASDGYLNDQNDSRSLFHFSRDLSRVRIVFLKDGVSYSTFKGIINDQGTTLDAQADEVSLVVQGLDSVLQQLVVPAGTVGSGDTFQDAIIAVLNAASGGILSINADNINPSYNGTVDVGTEFDNQAGNDALDDLLLASNSVLIVDSAGNAYVQDRNPTTNPILFLYGKGQDTAGRENITALANYNTGLQRTFNNIQVTGGQPSTTISGSTVSQPAAVGVAQNATSIAYYGLRTKALTLSFITELTTLQAIAANILAEFGIPKAEVEITLPTKYIQAQTPATGLLDLVSLSYPLTVRPWAGGRLPIIGITAIGDTTAPLPFVTGSLSVDPSIAWKVIAITEDPQSLNTTIKLRVKGTTTNDGGFDLSLTTEGGSDIETEGGETIETESVEVP